MKAAYVLQPKKLQNTSHGKCTDTLFVFGDDKLSFEEVQEVLEEVITKGRTSYTGVDVGELKRFLSVNRDLRIRHLTTFDCSINID